MATILDEIIAHKEKEVADMMSLFPEKLLEKSTFFDTPVVSMKKYLTDPERTGIIAEFKRKSPSKGVINDSAKVERTTIGYMQAGASALSVLTDTDYFGGSNADLMTARKFNFCPILRKDFIVTKYQIKEAKSIGADVILLIAAALTPDRLQELAAYAKELGLEVLMEVHDEDELKFNLHDEVDMIGVNNRNLKTFEVSLDTSKRLAELIPDKYVKVAESGLKGPDEIVELKKHGFQGFLIGETFMANGRPDRAADRFIQRLRDLEK
ncbi:MAG TPA: indole-3-glycerol phosphate synthase TrpC [Cytophagales bacterium]|nr:indole-3-glycerol phosphate synthase TrpC [Cytophagales bacterium]HAA18817.1 indole-3-glycerol phosphate synthase TrpC [Cytophagales bacterium]HAP64353.1 indole-3-glycerol phosphate synthase TrpC [Cytophagales bacterium]